MADRKPIVFDDDNPEWTRDDFARARPISEFPKLTEALATAKARGRPKGSTRSEKSLVSLRLDKDVLERFRAGGQGWQSRINATLRAALATGMANRAMSSGGDAKRQSSEGHKTASAAKSKKTVAKAKS
jgi:uncharacterized protein (DUF4415 family)